MKLLPTMRARRANYRAMQRRPNEERRGHAAWPHFGPVVPKGERYERGRDEALREAFADVADCEALWGD